MLAAAGSLAYYGYSYSKQLAERERQAILGTMSELAKEKLIGIQTAIADGDRSVYESVDLQALSELGEAIASSPHLSATVLGADKKILSGGSFRKSDSGDDDVFRDLLTKRVIPDLKLDSIYLNQTHYLHREYEGRLYLFSCTRRFGQGRSYFVVLEADISYLFTEVFPAFFDAPSPNLYQVVTSLGELVYGYSFGGIADSDVVELRFPETVTEWRLRVAHRDAGALATSENRQRTLDFVLIGVAMTVIAAGLLIMMAAVRRERRVSELKSDFISNVSHELKTPLSIISMFGELLAMGRAKSPEKAVEYAEIIRRESMRLSSLIDNVLDFAKIERGVAPYQFEEDQDLIDVVTRALELCKPRVEQAKMDLQWQPPDELPLTNLDGNAMLLAVQNLVDNAVKYAASGEKIEVSLARSGKRLELLVRDYGPGIPPEEQSRVFERFYRAEDVRLKPVRGSGIGLSLVKHIAEAHGGGVEICRDIETGCAFRLWLPITGSIGDKT